LLARIAMSVPVGSDRPTRRSRREFGQCVTFVSRRTSGEPLEDLDLFGGQRLLAGPLVRLRKAIVRLGQIGLQTRCVAQLLNRLGVSLLVREQDAELQEALRKLAIERDRSSEQRFNLPHIGWWRSVRLSFPEAHRIVELSQRVSRVRVGETCQAPRDLGAERGGDAVHLTEKLVGARIRWRKVRGLAEGFDGVLVLPARVVGDPEAYVQPRRLRMACD
jgi:hypothetical protein